MISGRAGHRTSICEIKHSILIYRQSVVYRVWFLYTYIVRVDADIIAGCGVR